MPKLESFDHWGSDFFWCRETSATGLLMDTSKSGIPRQSIQVTAMVSRITC